MRPATGCNALEAQVRKQTSFESEARPLQSLPPLQTGPPTTFLIASEKDLDSRSAASSSNYGVRSLEEAAKGPINEKDGELGGKESITTSGKQPQVAEGYDKMINNARKIEQDRLGRSAGSSPAEYSRRPFPLDSASQPLTPISFASPMIGSSEVNSPKSTSPRRSDDDDSGNEDVTDAPQFIMPSIIMPSRRPFTARGNDLGKLKILMAGSSGSGKTTLIKSIVQICEDIVHVDSLSPSKIGLKNEAKPKRSQKASQHTKKVVEMYASTKAYPEWWAELEDSGLLRRRRSADDSVLERNLCFVDTPGYDSRTPLLEGMEQTLQYMESQMSKSLSLDSLDDSELLSILTARGGFHVDVVLYLIVHDIKAEDIEFIKRLSQLTNVVPLLAKHDGSSEDEKSNLKAAVQERLHRAGIPLFTFPLNRSDVTPPFTVCSSLSQELEDMDASLLMQPDYMQPLLPSDLQQLLNLLLDKDNASCLKHNAVKKLITWRQTPRNGLPSSTVTDLAARRTANFSTTLQGSSITDLAIRTPTALTYANARLADYTQREERLAQLRLASWAGSLQKSLRNERARYEALARGERLTWLRARLDECISDDTAVSTVSPRGNQQRTSSQSSTGSLSTTNKPSASPTFRSQMTTANPRLDPADPLGLMRWGHDVRQHGIRVLQIAGGVGLLGAVAIWAVRGWSSTTNNSGNWTWSWWGWAEGEGWGFLGKWFGEIANTRKGSDQWLWDEDLGKYVFR